MSMTSTAARWVHRSHWVEKADLKPYSQRPDALESGAGQQEMQHVWHLIEDFFEQNLVMKGLTLLGWVAVLVMGSSLFYTGREAIKALGAG